MRISAAVCEFNPFHNGHKYLLENMRQNSDYVLCIMSGNFVQRGEFAVCDKFIRAESAVRGGADLVIELPLPYALSAAETFARGSIGILDSLGFIDDIYFGSESDLEKLNSVYDKTKSAEFREKVDKLMKTGISYPDAYFEALGNDSRLCGGNDILALEYLKQLALRESKIQPHAVKRTGNTHDSLVPCGEYASASYLRSELRAGKSISGYTPFSVDRNEISDAKHLEYAVLSKLRQMSEDDFFKIADVNEGLEFRLKKSLSNAKSITEFFENVRTKRYTLSRIKRIILCSYLGVTKEMQENLPAFVNVLAANERGAELISKMKKESVTVPVVRYSDTKKLSAEDRKLYDFITKCDDLFGMTLPEIREVGYDMKRKFRKA